LIIVHVLDNDGPRLQPNTAPPPVETLKCRLYNDHPGVKDKDGSRLGSRVQGFKGSRVQGFKGSRVQGFKGSRVQGFKGSRVQGFKGSRVQGFKGSRVQGKDREGGSAVKGIRTPAEGAGALSVFYS